MTASSPVSIVVVAGHPALGLATSTSGSVLADALHATGDYRVGYAGRGVGAPDHVHPTYRTVVDDQYGERALITLVRDFLADEPDADRRVVVILMGPLVRQHRIARRLRLAGLRPATLLVSHAPIDAAPLNAEALRLLREFDVVVPFNEFAARAITAAERATGIFVAPRTTAIGLAVDDAFAPVGPEDRRAARRALIDADDDAFIIGSFARNASPKRLDLLLYLVRVLAHGEWSRCVDCGAVTIDRLDPTTMRSTRSTSCARCHGAVDHAASDPTIRAYVQTQELDDDELRAGQGFDLDALVIEHRLSEIVRIDRSLHHAMGLSRSEVARRMNALDVHVVPAEASAWELSVLESGACGVPNVVTDYAGPAEFAGPFAELVPVAAWCTHPTGVQLGTLALDRAVESILRIRHDAAHRAALEAAGPVVARRFSTTRFGEQWRAVLATLDPRREPDPDRADFSPRKVAADG